MIWDKASWHKSEQVSAWVKAHNQKVKQAGGVRLLTWLLPAKSPWLNPQEPRWMHCNKHVVEPDGTLTRRHLKERVRDYFDSDAPITQNPGRCYTTLQRLGALSCPPDY